eukprot:gene21949-28996_t
MPQSCLQKLKHEAQLAFAMTNTQLCHAPGPALQKLKHEAQLAFAMTNTPLPCPRSCPPEAKHEAQLAFAMTNTPTAMSPGPALQKLNHEAQLAFVMIKYLDLAPHNMEAVVAATSATGAAELWSSRAAGLLYLQYVWWRQCFLMSPSLTQKLEDVVVERLPDSKAEVRHIAAATLSGMVKGMADDEAAKLRCSIIAKANAAMGSAGARKRSKSATGGASQANEASLLEKQGIVQGLKAFLLSSPYECPPWVPEVLVALFPAAGAGQGSAQLRADASKALSEFKRTHEQWDTYQEATSSASYFA